MRRWLIVIGIVVIGVGTYIAATLFFRLPSSSSTNTPRSSVPAVNQTQPVTSQPVRANAADANSAVTATGGVVARGQSDLSFDIPGVVVELDVTEGQHVQAGQVLARIDDTDAQFAFQQADAAVQSAQAALDKLLEPVDARDVANAEANVQAAEGNYSAKNAAVNPATIKAMQLQYQQAVAAAQAADYTRAGLGGQYSTDDPNYQKGVALVGIAQTNAQIAQLKLEQATRGVSLESAAANIAYAQAQLARVKAGTKQIDVDDAQAQLVIAMLQRDQAQQVLDKTNLVAPFSGIASKVIVKLNELSTGPAMVLTDDSQLYVEAQVAETDIGQIHVGQAVESTFDALPGITATGKVQRIDQLAGTVGSVTAYTVRVALDKTDAPIKITMTANVNFMSGTQKVRTSGTLIKQDTSARQ